jgi:UDP-GlcNAc:undecaprenyl-phosphate GlcNAc-1-phosphate transferase
MGDAGSLFLGFVLAVLLLKLRANAPTRVPVAVILAIPGLALFDTALVSVTRLARHVSPFQGGQDHTSHRLVRLGLPVPAAVGLLYGVDVVLGGAAIGMSQLGDTVRVVGVVAFVALGCLAAVPLARVPVGRPALPAGARSGYELPVTSQARVGVPAAGDFSTAERLGRRGTLRG